MQRQALVDPVQFGEHGAEVAQHVDVIRLERERPTIARLRGRQVALAPQGTAEMVPSAAVLGPAQKIGAKGADGLLQAIGP